MAKFFSFTFYSFITPSVAKARSRISLHTVTQTNMFCTSKTTYVRKQSLQMGYRRREMPELALQCQAIVTR